jgi:TRAP-type mannitol/chloroaromatic compound transport system permease small subunit
MDSHWFNAIYTKYGIFVKWTGIGAGMAALAMMLLVSADIIGRKFFNAPVAGAYEITESLLTFSIYFGVTYTQYERGHVRVTLFTDKLSGRFGSILLGVTYLVGFIFFIYVAYCMASFAWDSWTVREIKPGLIEYPLYPIKALAAVGMFLLGVQFLLDTIREFIISRQFEENYNE